MYARCLSRVTCKTLKTPYIQVLYVRGTSQSKINLGAGSFFVNLFWHIIT